MTSRHISKESMEEKARKIWQVPSKPLAKGAWLWWFWLFFIHDENTVKTGKCRQLMILWSVKNDRQITCNGLDIRLPWQIKAGKDGWELNGAAAAWYFDGKKMHDDFVLETSKMSLDPKEKSLVAPGSAPSSFFMRDDVYITKIRSGSHQFEFHAIQSDKNPAVGPHQGETRFPLGLTVEGTRIEILQLSGTEWHNGMETSIRGTAYFQKILLAAPPPQWYWGIYHFPDGSYFTYMQTYLGRALLAGNAWKGAHLKKPSAPLSADIYVYHAPSGRFFEGHKLQVTPEKIEDGLWRHKLSGIGNGFELSATAESYAHSCWKFEKKIGVLPARSSFMYNEYPSVLTHLELRLAGGEILRFEKGVGNMENSWGFLI